MATDWLKLENRIRATPLDLLRQGVEQRSWEAIDAAFTMLTGEPVHTSNLIHTELPETPAEIEANTPVTAGDLEELPQPELAQQVKNFGQKQKVIKKNFTNKFVDNEGDATEDKSFNPANMAAKAAEHARNTRPTMKLIDAKCTNCGTVERVHPELVLTRHIDKDHTMRYLCNSCSKGK